MARLRQCSACGYPHRVEASADLLGRRCHNADCRELLDPWEARERWSSVPMVAPYYPPTFPR